MRYKTKSGKILDVAVGVQAGEPGDDGRPSYYIGFITNISDRRLAERNATETEDKLYMLHRKIGQALGEALGTRDAPTARHHSFVTSLSERIAVNIGLSNVGREVTVAAASVHDVGKTAIPIDDLAKTSRLEDLEMQVIRTHARHGYEIPKPIETDFPGAEIAYQHHQRLDGSGYPRGLKNGAILQGA